MTGTLTGLRARIVSKPDVMVGKPCVAGTRVTVEVILRRMAEGYTIEDVLADYPVLTAEDIRAALDFAADASARPVAAAE
jgi:uncharacterized protein (DUF433 family)